MVGIDFDELFDRRRGRRTRRHRLGWWWVWLLLLMALLIAGEWLAQLATEWLWFASLGQTPVFRLRLLAPLAVFGFVFALLAVWLAGNWLWAQERTARLALFPGQRPPPLSGAGARRLVLGAAVLVAALLAVGAAARWETVLLFAYRVPFGHRDPLLGREVAFYVFELPLFRLVHALAMSGLVTALIGAVVIYVFGGLLDLRLYTSLAGMQELRRRMIGLPRQVRRHLWLLAALWALGWAVGQWLARFDLLFVARPGGTFFGPGYVDRIARLPSYNALVLIGVLVSLLFVLTWRGGRSWLPLGGVVLAVVLRTLLLGVYPGLLQRYRVTPNELALERPYIAYNIELTRLAFGLDRVTEVEYRPQGQFTPALLAEHQETIDNVRLWDWRTLLDTFRQLQEIRNYYDFLDVDIDRYQLAGAQRQVELATREITPSGLATQNPTWVNRRLEFTHGFGVVLAPVDEVDDGGFPVLWVSDIPPVTQPPFDREVRQPRVYFGEAADEGYVIVNTAEDEFDYPSGAGNIRTTYQGADGIRLNSFWRRLLFALRFGDSEIFFSSALKPDSRILIHRQIVARVRRLAPFLALDPDPYMVITDEGRLVWLLDAYTVSNRFPYAQPVYAGELQFGDNGLGVLNGKNYIRNSVKIAVDAYDGTVNFYIVDPTDPLIQAWSAVYPTLFRPGSEMPADLVAHWRYPEALFRAQAAIFRRYHMADPDTFYNAEDLWAVPTQTVEQDTTLPLQPYYVTMRLRGEATAEFLLMLPFTPVRKQNMIAWLAARCDPPNYGQLVLYRFAKGQIVFGPQQVESQIDQDPMISSQLTLWGQSGSRAIRGNLLVIPIGDTLLYVEPLYLQAETGAVPQLKQVIVASGDRVVMRDTLDAALEALFEAQAPVAVEPGTPGTGMTAPGAAGPSDEAPAAAAGVPGEAASPGELTTADVAALVRAARERERAAGQAAATGDWSRFGREMDALTRLLDRLAEVTGAGSEEPVTPPAPQEAPSPTPPAGDQRR